MRVESALRHSHNSLGFFGPIGLARFSSFNLPVPGGSLVDLDALNLFGVRGRCSPVSMGVQADGFHLEFADEVL